MSNRIWKLLVILFGNFLYALAVKLFLIPVGLITGGTTGIALTLNHYFSIDIPTFVFIFNMIMLAIGWLVLGKRFALTTVVSSISYPMYLKILDLLLPNCALTHDAMLATVFTGLGIGLGLGLVIRNGASTGGMDIPPLVLNHYFKLPVSVTMYGFDFLIILLQALYSNVEMVLFGILLTLIYTYVLDKLIILGQSKTEVLIVSNLHDEIRKAILTDVDRGVTLLNGKGGYTYKETDIVLSIISNRELPKVERLVHNIDPEAFIIVNRVSEVKGHGFTTSKQYK